MKVWRVWSIFDFGQHNYAFSTKEAAEAWAKTVIENNSRYSWERLKEEHMVGVREQGVRISKQK